MLKTEEELKEDFKQFLEEYETFMNDMIERKIFESKADAEKVLSYFGFASYAAFFDAIKDECKPMNMEKFKECGHKMFDEKEIEAILKEKIEEAFSKKKINKDEVGDENIIIGVD